MKNIVIVSMLVCAVACSTAVKDKDVVIEQTTISPGVMDAGADVYVDAGTDADADSSATVHVDSGKPAPTNQATCIAECEVQHPKAAVLNKQFDNTCYLHGACEPKCNNVPPGKNYPATNDADAAAPVACAAQFAPGVDPIMTPSAECSTCLANTEVCCKLWVDIFGSEEGRSLNRCAFKCFSDFKN